MHTLRYPKQAIVVDPDDRQRLYLGTDLGVIVSMDGGQTWMIEERGFGSAVTMGLSLIRTAGGTETVIRVYTWPRGVARHSSAKWITEFQCAGI